MDTIDSITYLELKRKVAAIPVKVILSGLLIYFAGGYDKLSTSIFVGMILYSLISIFWWFIVATGNWLVGIIAGIVALIVFAVLSDKLSANRTVEMLFALVFFFGSIVLDIIRVIRLIRIWIKAKKGF